MGYISNRKRNAKITMMHRLVMNCEDDILIVDHIKTGIESRKNNRKSNLRICTNQENGCNRSLNSNNKSGVTGIYFREKYNSWEVSIKYNQQYIYLGTYKNKDDAIKARLLGEVKYFGEFAPQKYLFEKYGITTTN